MALGQLVLSQSSSPGLLSNLITLKKRDFDLIHIGIQEIFSTFFQNSLDITTFGKVMDSLESSSSKFKTTKTKFVHLLHGIRIWISAKWNIFENKEEYVITKDKEL